MGRIKTALVKRTAVKLLEDMPDTFTQKFDDNKKVLGEVMPSKRIRNMIAGYITRRKISGSK